jgi:hypothetical protein
MAVCSQDNPILTVRVFHWFTTEAMDSSAWQNRDSRVLTVTYSSVSSRFNDAGLPPDALFLRNFVSANGN